MRQIFVVSEEGVGHLGDFFLEMVLSALLPWMVIPWQRSH